MPSRVLRTEGDRAAWARFLAAQPLPCTVSVRQGGEKRRDAQNRFSHEAYAQIARALGDRTTEDVRAESKLCIGIPIMRHHPDFCAKYDQIIKPLPYAHKLALMVEPFDFPVTRLMNVKEMTEYIEALLRYWDERGASAMMPEYDL